MFEDGRSRPSRGRSPSLAATLSFIWPGLGQALAGDRRAALVQALPVLALVAVLIGIGLALGPAVSFVYLLQPIVALVAGVLIVVVGLWRAASIVDAALRLRPWHGLRPPSRVVVAVLLVLVVLMHGWAGTVVWSAYQLGQRIGQPVEPTPPPASTPSGQTPDPNASPTPTPSPAPLPAGRVTVLVVGRDAGPGEGGRLTDVIQVVSYDPATGEVAIVAVPRDTAQLPLFNGGTWDRKINELALYAERHPDEFPDGGIGTLRRALEFVIGIPIQYYAQVDFSGFVELVDAVGGVDVVLDRPIADPAYQISPTEQGFYMDAGEHHLDGRTALMYVRSRHGPGNNDFRRARRQQDVLLALRNKVDDPQVMANLPSVIDAVSEMVRTDVPLDRLPELLGLLQQSTGADTRTHVLRPPNYAEVIPRSEVGNVYMIRLKMDAVAELSVELYGEDSHYSALQR